MTLSSSLGDTSFALTSSANSNYEFVPASDQHGHYDTINLLRFAEMKPHIVVAHESRNSTEPIDLTIKIRVSKESNTSSHHAIDTTGDGKVPLAVVITLAAVLGITIIGAIFISVINCVKKKRARRTPSSSSFKNCCSKLNCLNCRCPCRRGKTIGFVT